MADDDDKQTGEESAAERRLAALEKRLAEQAEQKREAEKRAKAAEDALAAKDDAGKGDVERLTAEVEKLKKAAVESEEKATKAAADLERTNRASLIRDAAAAAGFHDASTAARLVDMDGIEDADAAKAAVGKLAKDQPFLVKPKEAEKPTLRKVLGPDGTVDEKQTAALTEEARRKADGEEFMAEVNKSRELAGMKPIETARKE